MKKVLAITLLFSLVLATSCKKKKVKTKKEEYVETVAKIAFANYNDAYNTAVELRTAINTFTASPSEANFQNAKDKWIAAREVYGQSEVFRFQNGPIDDADGPEGALNAWPLDEGYIDYVQGVPTSGLINDLTVTIDKATLESKNEMGGEKNISIGYHAIEFLLWGQDDADASLQTAGQRPYTDYVVGGTAANPERRADYLEVCADLLVDHLQLMVNEWKEGGSYRATFTSMDADDAIKNILTGMGVLSKSELAGERMFVALDNADQEDEHSCFSDNTHRDVILNAQGIYNLYMGTYTSVDGTVISGTSLKDILTTDKNDKEADYTSHFESTLTAVKAVPNPFDYALTQESVGGSGPIMTAITALQEQGDNISAIASDLEITISTDLPE